MRAADPVENSGDADVVRIDGPAARHHPTPVYAKRADDGLGTGTLSLSIELRRQPAQLAQWLIVFGALGLVIGGAKWLNARQAVEPERPVVSSTAAPTSRQRAAVRAALPPDVSVVPGPAIALTSNESGAAVAARTVARVPATGGGEPPATAVPAPTLTGPTVRAPARVPYPRRIHDVQPRVPGSVAMKRGIAILALLIDAAGNVAEVETLRTLDPELDAAAIAAARLWKFEPTMHQGKPVAVRANFTVRFGY